MDELLESLINKAKNESQDAHRQLLCALNGKSSNVHLHLHVYYTVKEFKF